MRDDELEGGLDRFEAHLKEIAATFNAAAVEAGLPVVMDPTQAVASARAGVGLARVASFFDRQDDTGIIHQTQLRTMVECLRKLWDDQHQCGHVLGAMQSGKTTTSLALQWAGPALYALSGTRAFPFYLIGSQTSHQDQTTTELARFWSYYGEIQICRLADAPPPTEPLDALFLRAPTLATYREHVLRFGMDDVYAVPQFADNVHRRVGGQGVEKVAELCRRANERGFRPLMIIDEPQFGASDRVVVGDEGPERKSCVLAQMFNQIEHAIGGDRGSHWFVGLSATPFELNDLESVWEVRQSLTPAYSGFNYFNGTPISEGIEVIPPTTMGLSDFANEIQVPFMADVSMAAYPGTGRSFETHARRIGFSGTHDEYQRQVEAAVRESILKVASGGTKEGPPIGLCVRAFNSNERTEGLIRRLSFDPKTIEIIEYFGTAATNLSVKRMIARRQSPHLPYAIFVTNRARMADAFPIQVAFFLDFAQKASDLNALLQGLLGRACGYNKRSTVVLSDQSAAIVDDYIATNGGYVHKTSRHSVALGGYRRGAPTSMLKVTRDLDDRIVQRFFERIDAEVVATNSSPGQVRFSPKRASGTGGRNFRTGPILPIAQDLGLFDHLEHPEVRAALYQHIPGGFKIARASDAVRHPRDGSLLRYALSEDGSCRFTFRWSERGAAAQGGAQGRAQGQKDVGQHMEPTVYIEKFDPSTGEIIFDRKSPSPRSGSWRAFMVTFPLREPVRELRPAEVAYPIERSVYDDWMTDPERGERDMAEAAARPTR